MEATASSCIVTMLRTVIVSKCPSPIGDNGRKHPRMTDVSTYADFPSLFTSIMSSNRSKFVQQRNHPGEFKQTHFVVNARLYVFFFFFKETEKNTPASQMSH